MYSRIEQVAAELSGPAMLLSFSTQWLAVTPTGPRARCAMRAQLGIVFFNDGVDARLALAEMELWELVHQPEHGRGVIRDRRPSPARTTSSSCRCARGQQ